MSPDAPLSAAQLFDAVGSDYERAFENLPEQHAALAWLRERLPTGARVLDVGSGTGVPTARILADSGYEVEGIDVSTAMVALARRQVPGAVFHIADVREYRCEPDSFDAICAFFPLLQMTRAEIDSSLHRMASRLRPGGYLIAATIPADIEQADIVFMGHPARASSFAAPDFLNHLRQAGLEILESRESTFTPNHEGAQPEPHLFAYCRRPLPAPRS